MARLRFFGRLYVGIMTDILPCLIARLLFSTSFREVAPCFNKPVFNSKYRTTSYSVSASFLSSVKQKSDSGNATIPPINRGLLSITSSSSTSCKGRIPSAVLQKNRRLNGKSVFIAKSVIFLKFCLPCTTIEMLGLFERQIEKSRSILQSRTRASPPKALIAPLSASALLQRAILKLKSIDLYRLAAARYRLYAPA